MSHRVAVSSGHHHFSQAFYAVLSSIASANSRFSLAFSASSARNRFASLTLEPARIARWSDDSSAAVGASSRAVRDN
jgi:hypothetical protein